MWAKVESDNVTKIYARPTALTVGDVNYPANIMGMWSTSELEAIGIYAIVEDSTNRKDTDYYINTNMTYTFASGTVTASYGTATAQDLTEVKTRKKGIINDQANSKLSDYDWYTLRAACNLTNDGTQGQLALNSTTQEPASPYDQIDFYANGFKMRFNGDGRNVSGNDYIYWAFARDPFVTSGGVPATAK